MKQPIVLESNQNHATITDNGICPTLPASMGMGGGYVPMIAMGVDSYNQVVSLEVAEPLRAGEGGDERAKGADSKRWSRRRVKRSPWIWVGASHNV